MKYKDVEEKKELIGRMLKENFKEIETLENLEEFVKRINKEEKKDYAIEIIWYWENLKNHKLTIDDEYSILYCDIEEMREDEGYYDTESSIAGFYYKIEKNLIEIITIVEDFQTM